MALGSAVQGAIHTPQTITWRRPNGHIWDLSGGTLTGMLVNKIAGSTARAITGALAFVGDGSSGKFTWTYSVADVVLAGKYYVQFTNTHGDTTFDRTEKTEWEVLPIIAA